MIEFKPLEIKTYFKKLIKHIAILTKIPQIFVELSIFKNKEL